MGINMLMEQSNVFDLVLSIKIKRRPFEETSKVKLTTNPQNKSPEHSNIDNKISSK